MRAKSEFPGLNKKMQIKVACLKHLHGGEEVCHYYYYCTSSFKTTSGGVFKRTRPMRLPCMPRLGRRMLRVCCHTVVELYEEEGRRRHRNVLQETL